MFVVKLFAAAAIALGDWSVDWGLDEPTMRAVVSTDPSPVGAPDAEPPAVSVDAANVDTPIVADTDDDMEQPRELGTVLTGARRAIHFWKWLVGALAAGYQAGFLWVSAVGIYLLMRREIDGVQLNEVYIDPADEFGLPPLADEATTGVPEVAPSAPAHPGDTGPA
jgi:hypothetical protein